MKRIVLLLALIMSVVMAACGNADTGEDGPVSSEKGSVTKSEEITLSEYINEYNEILRSGVEKKTNFTGEDSDYIACAQTLLNGMLKNPYSAQYNATAVYEKDSYGRAIVYMDVSSQNSFGGWVREEYFFCIQSLDKDGNFTYLTYAYYVTGGNSQAYELLKSMNDFGKDPADTELKGMLLDETVFEAVFSVELIEGIVLECYMHELDCGKQYVYIDKDKHVLAIRNQISETTSVEMREKAEKVCVSSVAAFTGKSEKKAKSIMSNVASFETFASVSAADHFDDGFVYECDAMDIFYFTITSVGKTEYNTGVYWTPNNTNTYYEKIGDQYFEQKNYDAAIRYYEKAGLSSDKTNEVYYCKAEDCLAAGDYEAAGQYFGYAKGYKDAEVRVLEVYYQAGEKREEEGDYISAIRNYEMAGNHSDAKSRLKKVIYEQGKVYCDNKQYVEAIDCFKAAADYENAKEKYKEMNYLQGEQLLALDKPEEARTFFKQAGDYKDASTRLAQYFYESGCDFLAKADYEKAINAFKSAGNYEDAKEKYKEANYLYGEQLLLLDKAEEARLYFNQAGDYKDASTRLAQYFYERGCEFLATEDYAKAVNEFKASGNYEDAKEKYKESNYLYGEELLEKGQIESASTCFKNASGYSDADTRMQRFFYEKGTEALEKGEYLSAEAYFIKADTYQDAATMVLECYYLYGKQQLELNYVSNATKYLSKCRGYKDTDDILLGYYYTEATKAVKAFTKMVHEWSFIHEVNDAYEKAQNKLLLCEGYKDSVSVLKAIEKIYYLWDDFSDESNYAASFGNMTVEDIGETVTITQEGFTQWGGSLTLVFDVEAKTFHAEIKDLYWRRNTIKDVMCALVRTLTEVKKTEDLSVMFEDDTQWISTDEKDEFYVQYGGYLITVIEEATEGWYVDCTISATK